MLALLGSLLALPAAWAYPSKDAPLNQYPFVLTHDAASGISTSMCLAAARRCLILFVSKPGELVEARDHVVAEWAKTQSVGLVGQLDCGSRAFDYRPYCKSGNVFAHHGGVVIHKPMDESLTEIVNWCGAHPDELVILYLTAFDGDENCYSQAYDLVSKHNIATITNCSNLQSLTYNSALTLGKLSNGGNLIALFGCVNEQYDPENVCYRKGSVCYDSWPEGSTDVPWNYMTNYMESATSSVPVEDGQLWMAQAIWESDAYGCVAGTLHNSSLLLDERRSKLNQWVAQSVSAGRFRYINLLEVNDVCDSGDEILRALESFDIPH